VFNERAVSQLVSTATGESDKLNNRGDGDKLLPSIFITGIIAVALIEYLR